MGSNSEASKDIPTIKNNDRHDTLCFPKLQLVDDVGRWDDKNHPWIAAKTSYDRMILGDDVREWNRVHAILLYCGKEGISARHGD